MSGSTGTKEQVLEQKLVEIRRHLHRYPELSNEEVETTAYIRRLLEEQNITILDVPLRTGLVAEIGGQQEGPTVALRADIAHPGGDGIALCFATSWQDACLWA